MDANAWLMFFIGIAITSGLLALGVVLYPKLKNEQQGYPFEAAIEAALLPVIFQGVCSAYRLSEKGVDELHQRIKGIDKKKIADSIYGMLPDKIDRFDISIVKRVVPKERFEQLVQDAYDRFDRFFVEHQGHFQQQFEQWSGANQPGG